MDFGKAIEALKDGERIKRAFWPQGKFLWLKDATMIKESWCKDPQLKNIINKYGNSTIIGGEKTIIGLPVICICECDTVKNGWMADAVDILATDWMVC